MIAAEGELAVDDGLHVDLLGRERAGEKATDRGRAAINEAFRLHRMPPKLRREPMSRTARRPSSHEAVKAWPLTRR